MKFAVSKFNSKEKRFQGFALLHDTIESAKVEAKRLTDDNPDDVFYVLKIIGHYHIHRSPAIWKGGVDEIRKDCV